SPNSLAPPLRARTFGQESSRGGLGLFAVEAMKPEDSPPMALMGSFVVCDLLQLGQAMEIDGVPRYEICKAPQFSKLLQPWEVSNEGSTLYLKLERRTFLYYMNSS
ncbi:unnamed protein product, partial [Sphacelaria rigidula]